MNIGKNDDYYDCEREKVLPRRLGESLRLHEKGSKLGECLLCRGCLPVGSLVQVQGNERLAIVVESVSAKDVRIAYGCNQLRVRWREPKTDILAKSLCQKTQIVQVLRSKVKLVVTGLADGALRARFENYYPKDLGHALQMHELLRMVPTYKRCSHYQRCVNILFRASKKNFFTGLSDYCGAFEPLILFLDLSSIQNLYATNYTLRMQTDEAKRDADFRRLARTEKNFADIKLLISRQRSSNLYLQQLQRSSFTSWTSTEDDDFDEEHDIIEFKHNKQSISLSRDMTTSRGIELLHAKVSDLAHTLLLCYTDGLQSASHATSLLGGLASIAATSPHIFLEQQSSQPNTHAMTIVSNCIQKLAISPLIVGHGLVFLRIVLASPFESVAESDGIDPGHFGVIASPIPPSHYMHHQQIIPSAFFFSSSIYEALVAALVHHAGPSGDPGICQLALECLALMMNGRSQKNILALVHDWYAAGGGHALSLVLECPTCYKKTLEIANWVAKVQSSGTLVPLDDDDENISNTS